jgi:hypothetical protein
VAQGVASPKKRVQGQSGLHSETLSQKKTKQIHWSILQFELFFHPRA